MNQDTINSLKELLAPVAQKIGQTAEWGWGVVIKQMYVYAALGLFVAIVGVIVIIVGIKLFPWAKKVNDCQYNPEAYIVPIGLIIVGIIASLVGGVNSITHFLNPDFYAIQFFLDLTKQ